MAKGKCARLGRRSRRTNGHTSTYVSVLDRGHAKKMHERRDLVTQMVLNDCTSREIAETLNVSPAVASLWCKRLKARWIKDHSGDWRLMVAREIAESKRLQREAREAWERSQQPATTVRTVYCKPEPEAECGSDPFEAIATSDDGADPGELFGSAYTEVSDASVSARPSDLIIVEQTVEVRGQNGDPRFLAEQRACVDMRLDVLGAYKADTSVVLAGMIAPDQMRQFADTLIRGIEQRIGDPQTVQGLKEYVVQTLMREGRFTDDESNIPQVSAEAVAVPEVPASDGVESVGFGSAHVEDTTQVADAGPGVGIQEVHDSATRSMMEEA